MSKPVILIAGATSRNGTDVAELLLATGEYTVRLGARDPTKLAALITRGGQPVVLDSTLNSAMQAFSGIDSAYIIVPSLAGGADRTMFNNCLRAAKENGTKHIVYLSAVDVASPTDDFKTVHNHYDYEQLLFKSGIPYTVLRPTYFYENIVAYHANSIKRAGEFRTSAGDGVYTNVAIRDIAAAAAAALTDANKHAGKIYTLETEALTNKQLAEKITKAIGKPVTHVNLTPEEHAAAIKAQFAGSARPVEDFADGLVLLDKNKRENRFSVVRPDLELVLGRKGLSIDEFLAEHADAFRE